MSRKRKSPQKPILFHKKDLEYYSHNFKETCEKCGDKLSVIKYRPKSHEHREVVSAVCYNTNFKGKGFKCDQYCIEIRFIEKFI